MSKSKRCVYTQDLKLLLIASLLSIIFILIPPFNEVPIRIIFALLIIFFVPGYAFIAALFPTKEEISGIERFTLSVGFSIVIMVFDGFIVSLTEWKFRPNSITISLAILTLIFVALAYITRRRTPENKQFIFSYSDFIQSLKSEDTKKEESEDIEPQHIQEKKFTSKSRKKVAAVKTQNIKNTALTKNERVPPEVTKALMTAMILSIIIASTMFAYAKVTQDKEEFTAIYILGPNGMAENYPETFSTSQPIRITTGVENYEHANVNYKLQAKLDSAILKEIDISLGHEETWEKELVLTPTAYKQGKQKLEFALYKEGDMETPYRSVHLWMTQEISTEPIQVNTDTNIDFIQIKNPFMESNDGWSFTSDNASSVKGYYANGTGIKQSYAFVINSSTEGKVGQWGILQHSLSQEIYSNKTDDLLLSVFIKDSYTKNSANDESQFKRVILNNEIVWYEGVYGNENWQHLQIPVSIKEGQNTLTFALTQSQNMELEPVEIIIDEISFLPLSALSPYARGDNTIETDAPVSKVLQLAPVVNDNKFTVLWNGTDKESGIYYYDIDYSSDGINWNQWLKQTAATSAIFEGKQGITYYFRSKAVDNALNEEIEHEFADTSTLVDNTAASVELDISPNPTSDTTHFTVTANKPIMEVECIITPQNFGNAENIVLTTKDNLIWTAKYTVKVQDNYNVEVFAKDYSNNTAYTFDTLYTDDSLEEMEIQVDPEETSGDVKITISPSTALKENPSLTVKDRRGRKLDVSFDEKDGNDYIYKADVDDDTNDGVARITVNAKTVSSLSLYEEKTFLIDRVEPTINTVSPSNGETITSSSTSITASFSDNRAGIDRDITRLEVNGVDVTANIEKDYTSMFYNAVGLTNGAVNVRLTITDQAGNTEVETWSFNVAA